MAKKKRKSVRRRRVKRVRDKAVKLSISVPAEVAAAVKAFGSASKFFQDLYYGGR